MASFLDSMSFVILVILATTRTVRDNEFTLRELLPGGRVDDFVQGVTHRFFRVKTIEAQLNIVESSESAS